MALTRALASDFSGDGHNGQRDCTGQYPVTHEQRRDENLCNRVIKTVPAARFGIPEDIAAAAIFLAAEAGSYINGQTIYVDGGFTAVAS